MTICKIIIQKWGTFVTEHDMWIQWNIGNDMLIELINWKKTIMGICVHWKDCKMLCIPHIPVYKFEAEYE